MIKINLKTMRTKAKSALSKAPGVSQRFGATMRRMKSGRDLSFHMTKTIKGKKNKREKSLIEMKEDLANVEESHDPGLEAKMRRFLQAKRNQVRRKEVFDEPLQPHSKRTTNATTKSTRTTLRSRFKTLSIHRTLRSSLKSSNSLQTSKSEIDFDSELEDLKKFPKNEEDSDFIQSSLKKNKFFDELNQQDISMIVEAMEPISLTSEDEEVIDKLVQAFFIVKKGKVDVTSFNVKINNITVKKGESWGESNLMMSSSKHELSLISKSVEVYCLTKDIYRRVVAFTEGERYRKLKRDLRIFNLLEGKSELELEELSTSVQQVDFKQGQIIINKGDPGELFYFVLRGSVLVTDLVKDPTDKQAAKSVTDNHLGPGDYFGEKSLLDGTPRNATIKALVDVSCIVLDKETFKRFLGSVKATMIKNDHYRVLKSTKLLNDAKDKVIRRLVDAFELKEYRKGDVIVAQDVRNDFLYIINSGQVKVTRYHQSDRAKHTHVAILSQGDHFGESSLRTGINAGAEVMAETEVVEVYAVEVKSHLKALRPVAKTLKRNHNIRKREQQELREKKEKDISMQGNKLIKLEDLAHIRTLGTGAFGRVKLVDHAPSKQTFALKILQKAYIVQFKQHQNVMNEKMVMMRSDHPFILRLQNTFQTKNCLYFLLEYIQGGELFSLLQNQGGAIPLQWAKFYTSNVVSALVYLHKRQIVYRDLKPENLLIDRDGYIRIVDFGFAKRVTTKTFTLCGTPEYLSPETIQNTGHNRAADYWSLGILVYEMVAGFSPFADLEEDNSEDGDQGAGQERVFERILKGNFAFIEGFSSHVRHFIKSLLKRNPRKRLGMGELGGEEIKRHRWFEQKGKTDMQREVHTAEWWEKIEEKQVKAVWIPELNSRDDANYFDEFPEDDTELPYKGSNKYWAKF
eukprot:maker-scaffold_1-snap-gene-4.22-mRNA-1 protein AED:0.00 eAED:0.00 QI:53/1/0.75/1/1/1/4/303/911